MAAGERLGGGVVECQERTASSRTFCVVLIPDSSEKPEEQFACLSDPHHCWAPFSLTWLSWHIMKPSREDGRCKHSLHLDVKRTPGLNVMVWSSELRYLLKLVSLRALALTPRFLTRPKASGGRQALFAHKPQAPPFLVLDCVRINQAQSRDFILLWIWRDYLSWRPSFLTQATGKLQLSLALILGQTTPILNNSLVLFSIHAFVENILLPL